MAALPADVEGAIRAMASPAFALLQPVDGRVASHPFFCAGALRADLTPSVDPTVPMAELPPMPAAVVQVLLRYPPDTEFRGPDGWVFFAAKDAASRARQLLQEGQPRVVPLGLRYAGMGHVTLLACDRDDPESVFTLAAGGSNGWERLEAHRAILATDVAAVPRKRFAHWLQASEEEEEDAATLPCPGLHPWEAEVQQGGGRG